MARSSSPSSFSSFKVGDDLFCCEDAGSLLAEPEEQEEDEEAIGFYLEEEERCSPEIRRHGREYHELEARRSAVAWIIKTGELFRFCPPTSYLAVNYMDRFFSRRKLPPGGWPVQLAAVACLSLAAKMEESLVPSLLDLQEEGRFVFEPRTVQRMELLVLDALDWRLRYVTPFCFLRFFAGRAEPAKSRARLLVSRASRLVVQSLQEVDYLGHGPSATAAAAIICAAAEAASPPSIGPGSAALWCPGLTTESVKSCYQMVSRFGPESAVSVDSAGPTPSSSSSSSRKRRKLDRCSPG
ncbi:CYCLIN D1;1 isoform X2 [Wolffia australiana]